ncbi:hypothetical protein AGR13a_Cc320043 [Agrobacterium genomosp. 13 str. CFBP 6927]|uniref:Transposase n=1 Tax=Agrobacterium genomosp. 13 str. CFBP 6927 TaxID=1183428 RepID=A0ABM9VGF2_9HYPH|nr:hypothetical protein AGR13a_Cc320043 [Agrobacterium genomosp. 13 str. CFBP 6927]
MTIMSATCLRKVMLLLREKLLEGFSVVSRKKACPGPPGAKMQKPPCDIFARYTLD